ncbi:hypothetical protein [Cerasicoccus maritimus]|uniref:hypothetical protein n=1 Tax=Cerasicoccus maritimus TaxID=490089 RepID=UPI0028528C3D|nr:hypothetical protein [Cerasicoccus maritimus]
MIPLFTKLKTLFMLFVVLASVAYGQQSQDLQDLQQRHREARADAAAYLHIRSITVKGTSAIGSEKQNFELTARESGELRYAVETPAGLVIQVFDGEDGWRWVSGKPELGAQKLTDRQVRFFLLTSGFYTPFEDPDDFAFTPVYMGIEVNEEGEPEHHVQLVSSRYDDVMDVWIDAYTFLENRRQYRPEQGAAPLVMEFLEYERVDGVFVPMTVKTSFNGKPLGTTSIDYVGRNSGMLSFYFNKPPSYAEVQVEAGKIAAQ